MLHAAGEYMRNTSTASAQKLASYIGLPPGMQSNVDDVNDEPVDGVNDEPVQNNEFLRRAKVTMKFVLSLFVVKQG